MTIFTSHTVTCTFELAAVLFFFKLYWISSISFCTKEEEIRTQAQDPTYGFLSSSPLFYLCTSFSPPQSLSFQPFCVTTQNTKGEVQLKQNRSYPGFLVFLPGENVGEANRAPSFQSWQTSSQSRYPNIYSAVEFVMNVTSGIRVRYFWAARRFFKN